MGWGRINLETLVGMAGVPFVRGDTDLSGAILLNDGILILDHLFQAVALDCDDAADVNDDGTINIADAVFSLVYQFAGGPPPPEPFPDPGIDPTDDALGCAVGIP